MRDAIIALAIGSTVLMYPGLVHSEPWIANSSIEEDFDKRVLLFHAGTVCPSIGAGNSTEFIEHLNVLGAALGLAKIETAIHTSKMAEQHAAEYQADPVSYCRHATKVYEDYR